MNGIDKVKYKLMGLSMMEKNLVSEYFEKFEVLDDVNVVMHSLGSLCLILTFCGIIGNQTSLTLPILIREKSSRYYERE
jgi:hypothetical protein